MWVDCLVFGVDKPVGSVQIIWNSSDKSGLNRARDAL
jgi:hypothetical protein